MGEKDSIRYSQKAKTVEAPPTSLPVKISLGISISVQLLSGLVMFFVGIYAFTLCDPYFLRDFAGITPIIAVIYCLVTLVCSFLVCKTKRMAAIIFGITNFLISATMVVYESASYRCLLEPNAQSLSSMCREVCSKFNGCRWMYDDETVDTSAIPPNDFSHGSLALVCLAVITLISSITTFVFLTVAMKMGKPVYLALKRHKNSIVVGDAKNAEIANKNKEKNIELLQARIQEEDGYERKKQDRLKEYLLLRKKSVRSRAAGSDFKGSGFASKIEKPPSTSPPTSTTAQTSQRKGSGFVWKTSPSYTAGQISQTQTKSKSSDELEPSKFNTRSKKQSSVKRT